jgi:hypothetical protein
MGVEDQAGERTACLSGKEKFGLRRWQLQAHGLTLTRTATREAAQIRLARALQYLAGIIPEEDDARSGFQSPEWRRRSEWSLGQSQRVQ